MAICVEICVEDYMGVHIATDNGADRVELCVDLAVGGLTPPLALIEQAIPYAPPQGMQILVRPTAGSFVLGDADIDKVTQQISTLMNITRDTPVPVGFVVGAVTESGQINDNAARTWRQVSEGRLLTFHRAFDCVKDLHHGVDTLTLLEYDRVLTTGGHARVAKAPMLKNLVKWADGAASESVSCPDGTDGVNTDGSNEGGGGLATASVTERGDIHRDGRLTILASGGLRADNVARIIDQSGVSEVHMRAPMIPHNGYQHDATSTTDPHMVAAIVRAIKDPQTSR